MAELVQKWIASNGKMFDSEQEAVYEEKVIEIAQVLDDANGQDYDFNTEEAVRGLLKLYKVEKL